MTRVAALIACALLLASCRGSGTNVVLSRLERSEKIQLGCANVEQLTGNLYELRPNGIFPLALCDEDTNFASSVDAQSLGSVTQIESGTVAVVNFSNSAIFDTNRTVPGVTALRVGEQPTGIQISPVDARYTYVSSFSPKSVQAISTREVITGTPVSPDGDDEDLLRGALAGAEASEAAAGATDPAAAPPELPPPEPPPELPPPEPPPSPPVAVA